MAFSIYLIINRWYCLNFCNLLRKIFQYRKYSVDLCVCVCASYMCVSVWTTNFCRPFSSSPHVTPPIMILHLLYIFIISENRVYWHGGGGYNATPTQTYTDTPTEVKSTISLMHKFIHLKPSPPRVLGVRAPTVVLNGNVWYIVLITVIKTFVSS